MFAVDVGFFVVSSRSCCRSGFLSKWRVELVLMQIICAVSRGLLWYCTHEGSRSYLSQVLLPCRSEQLSVVVFMSGQPEQEVPSRPLSPGPEQWYGRSRYQHFNVDFANWYLEERPMRTTVPSPLYLNLFFRDFLRMTKEEKIQQITLLWYRWPKMCMAIREKLAEVDREKMKEEHRERNRKRHRRLADAVKQASVAVDSAAVELDEQQTEGASGSLCLAVAPGVDLAEVEHDSAAVSMSSYESSYLQGWTAALRDIGCTTITSPVSSTADAQEAGNSKKRPREVQAVAAATVALA